MIKKDLRTLGVKFAGGVEAAYDRAIMSFKLLE